MDILITESQYKLITESRNGMLNYLIRKSKEYTGSEWPVYVIKDWMYKKTTKVNELTNMFDYFIERYGKGRWINRVLDISIDVFTDEDKEILKGKIGGQINQKIPQDSERHNLQQNRINTIGVSPEPIIVYQTKDGKYDLIEGWHRTTAALKNLGHYKQNAWVYVPYTNLEN